MPNPKVSDLNLFPPNAGCLTHRLEHSVGNTVRKVLHHIREEYHAATRATNPPNPTSFSISKFVLQGQPRKQAAVHQKSSENKGTLKENDPDDPDSFAKGLKPVLMEAIQDVLDELETVYDNISKNAKDHIHSEYDHNLFRHYCLSPLKLLFFL